MQAVQYGNEEIVKKWLHYYKDKPKRNHYHDKHGFTPIHYAAKFNQFEIMKILFYFGKGGSYTLHTYKNDNSNSCSYVCYLLT